MSKRQAQPAKIERFLDRDVWIRAMLAIDNEVLSASTKLVAVRIALHLNINDGRCFPSVQTLAEGTRVCERHIPRVLAALERSGWLAITRSPGRQRGYGGRGRANSFRLMMPETLTPDAQKP
jgi:hypothetical protein